MLIGRVSELSGVTRKAIRYYESIGLINPAPRKGNYRVYNDNDVMVITMIRRAQTLGFSLSELKEIVLKKAQEKTFPIQVACDLIDKKMTDLRLEAESLLLKEQQLNQLKADLIEEYT
ncbi:MerR family transcriptional regulator [Pseudocolwellia agarivorans]|uniref:MerR family transcriptional regulator n=1 Tax=Pseudocolwellia agarivorans TaxID=1911682 RepID=UPI003F885E23